MYVDRNAALRRALVGSPGHWVRGTKRKSIMLWLPSGIWGGFGSCDFQPPLVGLLQSVRVLSPELPKFVDRCPNSRQVLGAALIGVVVHKVEMQDIQGVRVPCPEQKQGLVFRDLLAG